jgi:hypothetical protein
MEIRSFKVGFENGEIKAISLNAQLDEIYKKMFHNSRRSARRHPVDIDHGIKVIVFGCFWVEALCNNYLKIILNLESKKIEFSNVIWKKLKISNFFYKFEIISTFAIHSKQEQYVDLLSGLRKVFELRNRLAHFKDEDERLSEATSAEKALELIADMPIPIINQDLMWPRIREYADIISKTNIWLNSIYKLVCRDNGIRLSQEKINSSRSQAALGKEHHRKKEPLHDA